MPKKRLTTGKKKTRSLVDARAELEHAILELRRGLEKFVDFTWDDGERPPGVLDSLRPERFVAAQRVARGYDVTSTMAMTWRRRVAISECVRALRAGGLRYLPRGIWVAKGRGWSLELDSQRRRRETLLATVRISDSEVRAALGEREPTEKAILDAFRAASRKFRARLAR